MHTTLKIIKDKIQSLIKLKLIACCLYHLNIAGGIMLLYFCAKTAVYTGLVPTTLQTLGMLIIGLCYPPYQAIYIITAYLTSGILGLPVFSGYASGITYITGIRGGYLIGMTIGTWIIAYLRDKFKEPSYLILISYGFIGLAACFIFGISWITHFMGFSTAIKIGLLPFIIPELYKMTIASLIIYPLKRRSLKK